MIEKHVARDLWPWHPNIVIIQYNLLLPIEQLL